MRAEFMPKEQNHTYEKLYYTLWELAGRYSGFCQFRAVGNSHDDRLIPMLEVGNGAQMIFCVAGIDGTQNLLPRLLIQMAEEYCRAYECGWQLEEFYEVKKLLDKIRICFLPLLNPDGYEISQTIKLVADIKESTLYPILKKLEKAGYVTTYSAEYQGRKRKYYSITEEGKIQMVYLEGEWKSYRDTIDDIIEGRKKG